MENENTSFKRYLFNISIGVIIFIIIIVSFKFAPKIMYKLLYEKQVIETIKNYQGK